MSSTYFVGILIIYFFTENGVVEKLANLFLMNTTSISPTRYTVDIHNCTQVQTQNIKTNVQTYRVLADYDYPNFKV